jgi:tRNA A-37 threonylcarbamoyl transferase component Bud32
MDYTKLDNYTYKELKDIANVMGLKIRRSKILIIGDIVEGLKEYEKYKIDKLDKYTRIKQIGEKGKEGTTYLVTTGDNNEYAMKTFRKQKSSTTLRKEADLQKMAADEGISPNIIDIDTVSKYIVMEKMDKHLYTLMSKQNGELKKSHQKQIISIFKSLDKAKVFHGDSNILNYMFKGKKLYIIDFGMAKEINTGLIKKLGTTTPNIDIMTLGLVIKLKELGCPPTSYQYLTPCLSEDQRTRFNL